MHEPASSHTITITERGSFALARCGCGWTGPARRSRDRTRTDAADHLKATATTLTGAAAEPVTEPATAAASPEAP
ncbi:MULTISPECIES: hypothetical protein [unclassified Streptomyces]|uniref:hypothetical protein n=1 Tax=unclassified Streptomyces TaxID=2593676 RepID=UPI00166178B5|nr:MULTISPECIES: hypothetical protein [unclassified Streptomyces]MBD0712479.1 hypothetical protein [Streptomyces sp. CBMA291]MBD0716853.1 hypothetical protein [Streptomyces sp. CBMA370]